MTTEQTQRIEALEAELAALRASTYDKETINILVHTITRNDEAEDSIEDLKNAADMLNGKSILDALNAEYDNAKELAACKRDAERMDKLSKLLFAADFEYGEDGLNVLVLHWPKNVPVGPNLRRNVDDAMAAGEKA